MQTNGMDEGVKLQQLARKEEIAGKKCNVYARLLIDPALAQAMERLALRHEERRQGLLGLQGRKNKKKEGEEV